MAQADLKTSYFASEYPAALFPEFEEHVSLWVLLLIAYFLRNGVLHVLHVSQESIDQIVDQGNDILIN